MSSQEFRTGLAALLNRVQYAGERFAVTRHGHVVALLVPAEPAESAEEPVEAAVGDPAPEAAA